MVAVLDAMNATPDAMLAMEAFKVPSSAETDWN
jgi:hypothetical protein